MNEMTVYHFYDFYFLEALRAGMIMNKAQNQFRHSFERLERDVDNAFSQLCHTMAPRIRFYLWAAGLGEARHAWRICTYAISEIEGNDRGTIFENAVNYPMTQENIEVLKGVFKQSWGGAFGGRAWLDIVEAVEMYGNVSDATFIDHTVDLEHNSGSVFTKSEGGNDIVKLNVNAMYRFRPFLNVKFSEDILRCGTSAQVSTKVYNLLTRYNNVVSEVNLTNIRPSLEWLNPFDVEFGDETLSLTKSNGRNSWPECDLCTNKIDPEDHHHAGEHCICRECYENKYSYCYKCREAKRDFVSVDGESMCTDCCDKIGAIRCENCEDYFTNFVETQQGNFYCQDCAENHASFCETCEEWHEDMTKHNKQEHSVEVSATNDIEETIEQALDMVDDENKVVWFEFMGVKVYVTEDSDPEELLAQYKEQAKPKTTLQDDSDGIFDNPLTWIEPEFGLYVKQYRYNWRIYTKINPNGYGNIWVKQYSTEKRANEVMNALLKITNWNDINSYEDWNALPDEIRRKVMEAVS